jgi:inosine/xanthosine triphosphatase
MRVGVGTGNPVKVQATETALELPATVESVPVESGVPDQPRGHAETRRGAENRARNALAEGDHDLGVGVEGGVARFDDADGLYLVMWAAVTDGDRLAAGAGPALRLPDHIADRVETGEELGPVMDDVLGEDGVKRRQGAAGALTGGIIDRESALVHALAGALGPFVTDHYDN